MTSRSPRKVRSNAAKSEQDSGSPDPLISAQVWRSICALYPALAPAQQHQLALLQMQEDALATNGGWAPQHLLLPPQPRNSKPTISPRKHATAMAAAAAVDAPEHVPPLLRDALQQPQEAMDKPDSSFLRMLHEVDSGSAGPLQQQQQQQPTKRSPRQRAGLGSAALAPSSSSSSTAAGGTAAQFSIPALLDLSHAAASPAFVAAHTFGCESLDHSPRMRVPAPPSQRVQHTHLAAAMRSHQLNNRRPQVVLDYSSAWDIARGTGGIIKDKSSSSSSSSSSHPAAVPEEKQTSRAATNANVSWNRSPRKPKVAPADTSAASAASAGAPTTVTAAPTTTTSARTAKPATSELLYKRELRLPVHWPARPADAAPSVPAAAVAAATAATAATAADSAVNAVLVKDVFVTLTLRHHFGPVLARDDANDKADEATMGQTAQPPESGALAAPTPATLAPAAVGPVAGVLKAGQDQFWRDFFALGKETQKQTQTQKTGAAGSPTKGDDGLASLRDPAPATVGAGATAAPKRAKRAPTTQPRLLTPSSRFSVSAVDPTTHRRYELPPSHPQPTSPAAAPASASASGVTREPADAAAPSPPASTLATSSSSPPLSSSPSAPSSLIPPAALIAALEDAFRLASGAEAKATTTAAAGTPSAGTTIATDPSSIAATGGPKLDASTSASATSGGPGSPRRSGSSSSSSLLASLRARRTFAFRCLQALAPRGSGGQAHPLVLGEVARRRDRLDRAVLKAQEELTRAQQRSTASAAAAAAAAALSSSSATPAEQPSSSSAPAPQQQRNRRFGPIFPNGHEHDPAPSAFSADGQQQLTAWQVAKAPPSQMQLRQPAARHGGATTSTAGTAAARHHADGTTTPASAATVTVSKEVVAATAALAAARAAVAAAASSSQAGPAALALTPAEREEFVRFLVGGLCLLRSTQTQGAPTSLGWDGAQAAQTWADSWTGKEAW